MTRILVACSTLLLTTTVQADEPATTDAVPAQAAPEAAPAPEVPPAPPPVEIAEPEPPTAVAALPSEPQPYTGWGRGVRAPMYVNLMLTAGAFGEDGDNRLTTRIGAVLGQHHRLGGRIQSFVRPTKKVALDVGSTAAPTDSWGAVTFVYTGPEYLYDTDFGLYGGGSVGIGAAMSSRDVTNADTDDKHEPEKASAGVAGMLSLGYEWRASKWFAMNVEAFGGLYHGVDDNENSMNGGLFGLAMGVGF
jgi:hypothetical protein